MLGLGELGGLPGQAMLAQDAEPTVWFPGLIGILFKSCAGLLFFSGKSDPHHERPF